VRARARALALALLALAAPAPPGALAAEPGARVPAIGYLANEPTPESVPVLRQALADLGWHEGRTLRIWYRYAQGRPATYPQHAEALASLGVVLIVAAAPPAVEAARQAAPHVPIVMVSTDDPVARGFVASLAAPGGQVTGITTFAVEASARRVELLKRLVPALTRVAVLWNPANPSAALDLHHTQAAARALGVEVAPVEARVDSDVRPALAAVEQRRAGALLVLADPLLLAQRRRLVSFAERQRLPAMYPLAEFVDAGGLVAYGPGWTETFRRVAIFVDKILRGARPGDLPVERPRRMELVVNLAAARALKLPIPSALLLEADRVLQ